MVKQKCAKCRSENVEIIVEMDTNFHIGNHKPCLVPMWKCNECGFKYFDDVLGDAASKLITVNEAAITLKKMCRAIVKYNEHRNPDSEQFLVRQDMYSKIVGALENLVAQ